MENGFSPGTGPISFPISTEQDHPLNEAHKTFIAAQRQEKLHGETDGAEVDKQKPCRWYVPTVSE